MSRGLIFLFFSVNFFYTRCQSVSLEDIWIDYKYYHPSRSNITWLNEEKTVRTENGNLIAENVFSGKVDTLIAKEEIPDSLSIDDFSFSESQKMILLKCNSERLYRRSHKSFALVYDLGSKKLIYQAKRKVFNPTISPDEKSLAYTSNNDLYLVNFDSGTKIRVTEDGNKNEVINGRTDWVYEEEFGFTQAYRWIKGTNKLAFLKFDETEVNTYDIQIWANKLYPELYSYKYPKAGEKNSIVSVWIYDMETKSQKKILETNAEVEYIPKIISGEGYGNFYFATQNRLQNHLQILEFNTTQNTSRVVYEEKSRKYVENPSTLKVYENTLLIDSYSSGYHHFHLVNLKTMQIEDVTPGIYDAQEYLGFNKKTDEHYYTALKRNSYTQSICTSKNGKVKEWLKSPAWLESSFSPDFSSVLVEKSALTQKPTSKFFPLSQVKELRNWAKESGIKESYNVQFLAIPAQEGHNIPACAIYPPDFSENKEYPLLLHCYGGPGYQAITNKWDNFNFHYHRMLAEKGCVVVVADGRGTDGNGAEYRQATYGKLGDFEHQDQVTVAEYFRNKKYIDADRVGIWGWSFGGYLSSLCLLKSPDVFSMAIAVAPVTNWRYYDNIYTERYMGLPSENPEGYDKNSPTNYARNLKGEYLLIHGTADDNVHIQNSYLLQKELLKHNKQFETFFYPDKNHGIYGGTTRFNLYKKMTIFIEKNLLTHGN